MTARSLLYEKLNGMWLLKIIFKGVKFFTKISGSTFRHRIHFLDMPTFVSLSFK